MSLLEKYKVEGGWSKPEFKRDFKDVVYSDPVEFYMTLFDFCGCGRPLRTLAYIRDKMYEIVDKVDTIEATGADFFCWYVFDKFGLTEHGSCVPGWLTPVGKQVLDDLNMLLKEYDKEVLNNGE